MKEPLTQSEAVRNLQRYLRRLSFEENDILPVPTDGIFDERTADSLAEFQRMQGLSPTGTADKVTWDLLFLEYSRLEREEDLQIFPDLFPRLPAHYETEMGESGTFMFFLQFLLEEIRISYDTMPPISPTGIYDPPTAQAIEEFQRLNRLPVTGQVDRNTWNRLAEEYNRSATRPL